MSQPVIIEEYDHNWAVIFERLRVTLTAALGKLARDIQHVGSTSAPNLSAKPIIDIDVVIESEADLPETIARLSKIGYVYEGDLEIPSRYAFRAPADLPSQHLYVCSKDSPELRRHLVFRDYLRLHPTVAEQYGILKKRASERLGRDREAYTAAKQPFIEGVLREAMSSGPRR